MAETGTRGEREGPVMALPPTQWECLGLVIGASVLAGLLGIEREAAEKPAGFRTHMIIGGGTALLTLLGQIGVALYAESPMAGFIRADPLRVIEAIVVGVSFIGAGTILKLREETRIRYLTTAASVLFSAGIGMAVALQQFVLAAGTTLFVLLVTHALRWCDIWLRRGS